MRGETNLMPGHGDLVGIPRCKAGNKICSIPLGLLDLLLSYLGRIDHIVLRQWTERHFIRPFLYWFIHSKRAWITVNFNALSSYRKPVSPIVAETTTFVFMFITWTKLRQTIHSSFIQLSRYLPSLTRTAQFSSSVSKTVIDRISTSSLTVTSTFRTNASVSKAWSRPNHIPRRITGKTIRNSWQPLTTVRSLSRFVISTTKAVQTLRSRLQLRKSHYELTACLYQSPVLRMRIW